MVAAPATGVDYVGVWQRTEGTAPDTWESVQGWRWDDGANNYVFEVTPWDLWDNWSPAVATDGVGHLIVYAAKGVVPTSGPESGVKRHIYGRLWWPQQPVFLPLVLSNG